MSVMFVLFITGCNSVDDDMDAVEKGKYLVNLGGCNMCHTPKTMDSSGMVYDGTKLLSGHPQNDTETEHTASAVNEEGWEVKSNFHMTRWVGPWGISYAANLTPDEETGIGSWDEDMFVKIIRSGFLKDSGHKIQLPMPSQNLSKLSDDDLKAIFVYLKSIKPIKNKVPASVSAE